MRSTQHASAALASHAAGSTSAARAHNANLAARDMFRASVARRKPDIDVVQPQFVLGVYGSSPVSPGRLVLSNFCMDV